MTEKKEPRVIWQAVDFEQFPRRWVEAVEYDKIKAERDQVVALIIESNNLVTLSLDLIVLDCLDPAPGKLLKVYRLPDNSGFFLLSHSSPPIAYSPAYMSLRLISSASLLPTIFWISHDSSDTPS